MAQIMEEQKTLRGVLSRITPERIKSTLIELARIPSPLTGLLEAEPQLRRFIDTAVEPRLKHMGIAAIRRDRMGNLLATWGRSESRCSLMLVTNAMNQPPATMPNPYDGEVRAGAPYGLPGEVVLGKGLSEQKAPLAAILVALEAVSASAVVPRGHLAFLCCVSGETGRHDAIASIIEATGIRADMAVLNGTGNRISLGNRGRVDVTVTVHGSPCHSSRPTAGCNAITGAIEVIRRLTEGVRLPPPHPQLGPAGLTINRIRSLPDTTHTVQARCDIGIDRRLLPGENPDAAVVDIVAIAKTVNGARDPASGKVWLVEVAQGAMMYPSLVGADSGVVRALGQASLAALGGPPATYYATNAFDQGFLNHIGIEACTYGPGEADFAHTDLDMASVDRTRDAAKVYATLIMQQLA